MATKYYALLTERGAAKLAAATALGTQVKITQMAVGDGGGSLPVPTATQTALIGEKRRAALNSLTVDPANVSQIIAEQVIPESEGGFWIREIGVFDDAGELIAIANCAETYKPVLAEGSGRTQVIRMVLIVSSTDAVTLKIDPSVVLATRKYVDDQTIIVKAYADDLMAKHLAAADPHTQYAPKASPTLTGTPKAPTAATSTNTTQIATTAFVQAVIAQLVASSPAALDTLNELAAALGNDPNFATTVTNALALKAPLASPGLTGTPTAPTAAATVNTTQIATTAFVKTAIANLVASAPGALDTLNELAAALGNDANFATTMTNALALKAPLASPTFTGTPLAPTAAVGTSSTQIATMAALLQGMAAFGLGDLAVTITDLNAAPSAATQFYKFTSTAANLPLAGAGGNMLRIQYGATTYTDIVITLAGSNASLYNRVFTRMCNNGTVGAWTEQARLDSPAFTGTPTAPTAIVGTNSTQLATTAFTAAALADQGIGQNTNTVVSALDFQSYVFSTGSNFTVSSNNITNAPGGITFPASTGVSVSVDYLTSTGTRVGLTLIVDTANNANFQVYKVLGVGAVGSRTWTVRQQFDTSGTIPIVNGGTGATTAPDALTALGAAPLASPALTGTPTAPTAAATVNTTQIATTAFVKTAIANLVASAPGALDTLNELAAALGNDANFATTMTNALALKAPLSSPALTGTPTVPTPAVGTISTQAINAEFVTKSSVVAGAIGRLVKSQLITSSASFTPQAATKYLRVRAIAGGGGSGGTPATASTTSSCGQAGFYGQYIEVIIPISAITAPVAVTIGAGGAGGTSGGNQGGTGGITSFGSIFSLGGGPGGLWQPASAGATIVGPSTRDASISSTITPLASSGGRTYSPRVMQVTLSVATDNAASQSLFPGGYYGMGGDGNIIGVSTAATAGNAGIGGAMIIEEYA